MKSPLWALLAVCPPLAAQSLAPAPEPVPDLLGAGRPINLAATAARQEALLQRLAPGVAVIPAATPRDLEAEVLQDGDFRLGPGPRAAELSGIPTVLSAASLDSLRADLLARFPGPIYTVARSPGGDSALADRWARRGGRKLESIARVLDSMRVVKDADEIARLRRAAQITVEAEKAAMRLLRPGLKEYQIEATIEYTFRNLGADRVGFPSIVGSGPRRFTTWCWAPSRRPWTRSSRASPWWSWTASPAATCASTEVTCAGPAPATGTSCTA